MRGRPKGSMNDATKERYDEILRIAREHTEEVGQPQTIRHIYYVCSGLGIVDKDHGGEDKNYNLVRSAICAARWRGDLGWEWIGDATRELVRPLYFLDLKDRLESAKRNLRLNHWKYQDTRVILCVEKDAIAGILEPLCEELQVPFLPFRGQLSDATLYQFAEHIIYEMSDVERILCLYYGDCDPSGLTIDRSIFGNDAFDADDDKHCGKLKKMLYGFFDYNGEPEIEYRRIGITRDDLLNPANAPYILPANPGDRNYDNYILEMGTEATLGIDALSSAVLISRARAAITAEIDEDDWNQVLKEERKQRADFQRLCDLAADHTP